MMAGVRGDAVRVAVGAVAPTVVLAAQASAALSAGRPVAEAQAALAADIAPIDDLRSTASTGGPWPPTCWPASGVTRHDPVPVHAVGHPAAAWRG